MKSRKYQFVIACILLSLFSVGCQRSKEPLVIEKKEAVQEEWQQVAGIANEELTRHEDDERWELPSAWDNRVIGRTASIKNQGELGTCWAFAALGGLEALWLPQKIESFSVDHMAMNHGFGVSTEEGGNFTMALAYLASWKGPVWEADDPYADGATNPQAPVRAHLQEAKLLKNDRYAIKKEVLKNGAVQSSLYADDAILSEEGSSQYYHPENYAYYYDGAVQYNHDVLIIGWDDDYSRDNFVKTPEGDGAFICQNSWGEEFGDQGFFYVSYYDTTIAQNTLAYTRLDQLGVYDQIYQHDELGWTGQMGYEAETAWGANVYTAQSAEKLKAVSFYATDEMTSYEIYAAADPNPDHFSDRKLVAQGSLRHAGYYTIDLDEEMPLKAGQQFAVIVCITTPGVKMPLAAEYYQSGSYWTKAEVAEGESYISKDGSSWQDAGLKLQCNLCLKAFTVVNS